MIEMRQVHIIVTGRVQGVFFRDFTCRKAQSLILTGWVKNLVDNKVEIIAEGEKEKLNQLIESVKIGPVSAKVKDCQVDWGEFQGEFKGFEIVY
jgi:acylphosphatase